MCIMFVFKSLIYSVFSIHLIKKCIYMGVNVPHTYWFYQMLHGIQVLFFLSLNPVFVKLTWSFFCRSWYKTFFNFYYPVFCLVTKLLLTVKFMASYKIIFHSFSMWRKNYLILIQPNFIHLGRNFNFENWG